jgi:hypothetical protein
MVKIFPSMLVFNRSNKAELSGLTNPCCTMMEVISSFLSTLFFHCFHEFNPKNKLEIIINVIVFINKFFVGNAETISDFQ